MLEITNEYRNGIMGMKKILLLVILLFNLIDCPGCSGGQNEIIWSPQNKYKIEVTTDSRYISFKIFSKDDVLLHQENNIASKFHRWSFEWKNNTTILLRSSDIGDYIWLINGENKWIKHPANWSISSDGELIASVKLCPKNQKGVINIGKIIPQGGVDISYSIYTDIPIEDRSCCVSWIGNDLILLNNDEGRHYWKRMPDGAWHKAEKGPGRIWVNIDKHKITKKQYDINRFFFFANRKEQIDKALNMGADINARNPSNCLTTRLMEAVSDGDLDKVKLLLSRGVDVNLVDSSGRNVLFYAILVNNGSFLFVKYLLENTKIDINHRDDFGETVLMITSERKQNDIWELLRQDAFRKN